MRRLAAAKAAIHRLVCLVVGHRWVRHEITAGGVLTIVPRCGRCRHVDIDSINQSRWNRADRRRWSKQLGLRRRLS